MAKIRVIFGHQIRLNYGDPQPMALRGRLVAVAEIAPELLIVSVMRLQFRAGDSIPLHKIHSEPCPKVVAVELKSAAPQDYQYSCVAGASTPEPKSAKATT